MKELQIGKNQLQNNGGIVGYFPRVNAPSIDVVSMNRVRGYAVVGAYGSDEVYQVELLGAAPDEYFNFGVEQFHIRDMVRV